MNVRIRMIGNASASICAGVSVGGGICGNDLDIFTTNLLSVSKEIRGGGGRIQLQVGGELQPTAYDVPRKVCMQGVVGAMHHTIACHVRVTD
jgi:hypothetical protein